MKTLIVDDEQQIREGLKILLAHTPAEVIGEAANLEEAKQEIESKKPELLLLDINLQEGTGFDVLEALQYKDFKLVFITAYNNYAIKAFKYNAFDYILKPVDPEELQDTIQRISEERAHQKNDFSLLKTNASLEKVVIKTTERIHTIALKDIIRCEADQGYTHFYLKEDRHVLSSKPLKEYYTMFPEEQFVRVHQSHLVNWDYVDCYNKNNLLVLKNAKTVPVSVRRKKDVKKRLLEK